ncbi:trypsin-like peptidase domain-containing protein [Pseudonocardia nigra]|uniref:trypsin-like peptidase domain-containing protein n=1 Tax=Pseudonocardia nigra TaxID=1921578 RepID=UPI001C5D75CE|nr:trypsin-like peptidase domain-containing protein [Pseudonocardia nigra]
MSKRWRIGVLTLLLVVIAQLFAPTAAFAQPRALSSPEELNAMVEKSIVQITIGWAGYVLYSTAEGYVWSDEVQYYGSCSGFLVTPTGHIVTAGHCVQPDRARAHVIAAFLDQQVAEGLLTAADAQALLPDALVNWKVEGPTDGAPMTRVIQVVQPGAVDGAVLEDPVAAQLVDFRPSAEGDVALLKVEVTDAVPLPIADDDPKSGTALTAVGFPASVDGVVDGTLVRASFKTGTASSAQVSPEGVPQIEVNADLSGGMSGGPTVDAEGNVLGVNSFKISGEEQAFNFITDTTDLRDWLRAKGLQLAPPRSAPQTEPTATVGALPGPSAGDGDRWLPGWAPIVIAVGAFIGVATITGFALIRPKRQRSEQARAAAAPAGPHWPGHPGTGAWAPAHAATTGQSWPPAGDRHPAGGRTHCTTCGAVLGPDVRFCGSCGTPAR